ncbi:tRNA 2-thiouridine synthesizing protein A [Nitrosomonas marina]|uniref:tRNA 2-thiouridine synthesizing protein A n=1 Tax=Nitrosomonas marina TaxID=917 RepID=A0A1I0EXT8_9PROT|nr:sulfurtransferase TusA family protein [Nitrosomonas marina]SET50491.1 tRNA 2-thiouridine synthesizing protein A [Nitrosomonas marina]
MDNIDSTLWKFDQELDARGLVCPLPILRTKQSLAGMTSGEILRVVATDPGAEIDFQVFAEQTGNQLLAMSSTDMEFVFFLKKR